MDKSWLLDHRVIPQINQCRRLIQAEFGVKLHLTDEDLPQRLAEYAGKTRSATLGQLWQNLTGRIPATAQLPLARPVRMYRGQPIADDRDNRKTSGEGNQRKQIIYRGQRLDS